MAQRPKQYAGRRDIKPGRLLAGAAEWSAETLPAPPTYQGIGKHKNYWSDRDLSDWTPIWVDDGTTERCEKYDAEHWPELQHLLRDAIERAFIGTDKTGAPLLEADGYPKRAWAWIGDTLHEFRYSQNRQYHGFPLTRVECQPLDPGQRLLAAPRWIP